MSNFRLARCGSAALIGATTLVFLASCVSGASDLHDGTTGSGGGPPVATGSGGTPTANTGGASVGTTGGLPGNGGLSSTGGVSTTPTGGTSTTMGGSATGGAGSASGGSANGGGGTSSNGGAKSTGGAGGGSGGSSSSCSDLPPNNGDTCAHAVEYGWCTQSWLGTSCQRSCGKCTGGGSGGSTSSGGSTGTGGAKSTGGTGSGTGGTTTSTGGTATSTGGTTGGASVPLLTNGTQGRTTRYWDCCKPSCGWAANAQAGGKSSPATSCGKDGSSSVSATTQSVCSGGSAYQCNWGAPWQAGPNLSYGYAAFNGSNCGKCYQLDFTGTGDNTGAQSLKGKTMIVQAVNIGDIGANHFDLLIPGGGVGANNGCTGSDSNKQWGNVNGGAQSGGFLATCGNNMSCITDMCKTAFGSNSSLIAGCSWFVGWFAAANNPGVAYAEVPCPAEISNRSGLR